jgi:tRNA-dihydrouridine synthase A
MVLGPAQEYEHPITIQLGGSNEHTLAQAARVCEQLGYDEINLNVGCPSARVVNKSDTELCFGARLMTDPPRVARLIKAMRAAVSIPGAWSSPSDV